jgi:hypothetical protein
MGLPAVPPKKAWTYRKAKVPELLRADPNAERF